MDKLKSIYDTKITRHTLYCLVLFITLQTRLILTPGSINNNYSEYNSISLYLVDILLILSILLFSINHPSLLQNKKSIPKLTILIAGLELAIFLSIFLAPHLYLAIYKYSVFLVAIALFFILQTKIISKLKLYVFFIIGNLFQATLAIFQFTSQSSFSNKWIGLAKHDSATLGASVIETSTGERWLRAYGALDHPNILGTLLVTSIILVIILQINNQKERNLWLLSQVALTTLALALLFTFSRAAWLGLILALIYLFTLYLIQQNYVNFKKLLKTIIFPTVLILAIITLNKDIFLARFNTTERLEEKSINERTTGYTEAINIIKINPLFGTGIGNYSLNLNKQINNKPSWYYQPTHNTLLLIWAEIGLIGSIFFIGITVTIFWHNKLNLEAALIFPITTALLFDHWLWSLHVGILLFWVILSMINKNLASKY